MFNGRSVILSKRALNQVVESNQESWQNLYYLGVYSIYGTLLANNSARINPFMALGFYLMAGDVQLLYSLPHYVATPFRSLSYMCIFQEVSTVSGFHIVFQKVLPLPCPSPSSSILLVSPLSLYNTMFYFPFWTIIPPSTTYCFLFLQYPPHLSLTNYLTPVVILIESYISNS